MENGAMFLTIRDASRRFGVPENWLRNAVKIGMIPVLKAGNRSYLNAETLHDTLTKLFNSEV